MTVKLYTKQATSETVKTSIFKLRYAVYVEEMGRYQEHANHSTKEIQEPIDEDPETTIFATYLGETLVGTLRETRANARTMQSYVKLYGLSCADASTLKDTTVSTKFLFARPHRTLNNALALIGAAYKWKLEQNLRFNFLDCNDHLVRFFNRLGFRDWLQPKATHPEYGEVSILWSDLRDLGYLNKVRSPLAPVLFQFLSQKKRGGGGSEI